MLILLVFRFVINGIFEWIRERILLSGTVSFISTVRRKFLISIRNQEKINGMLVPKERIFKHARVKKHLWYPLIGSNS